MVTLAEEMPLAAVVANDKLATTCSTCFAYKPGGSLLRCSRCRVLHYCSRDCQKKDWSSHKYECMFLEKCSPKVPVSIARLICRIAMKQTYGGPLPDAFNGRSWANMMDHRTEIQKDPERSEFFVCVCHVLMDFMGTDYVPKPVDLMAAFGRITTNCFAITDSGHTGVTLGEGVYVGLSVHDHSCAPDCFILFDGPKAILRSPNRELQYTPQLTISYTDLMETRAERQSQLRRQYYFTCQCELCGDESRDHWGKSAFATCCPNGACLLDPRSPALSCYLCGKIGNLMADEVIAANQELDLFLQKNKDYSDLPAELLKRLQMYDRMKTILSPYNFHMADFAQGILDIAMELQRRDTCQKFARVAVQAYRRFLPRGHPELTTRLLSAAVADSFADTPTGQTLELFQEAYDASLLSHGPRHPLTSHVDHLLSQYRIRLQRDLACFSL